jgi:hypothetical protein
VHDAEVRRHDMQTRKPGMSILGSTDRGPLVRAGSHRWQVMWRKEPEMRRQRSDLNPSVTKQNHGRQASFGQSLFQRLVGRSCLLGSRCAWKCWPEVLFESACPLLRISCAINVGIEKTYQSAEQHASL